MSNRIISSAPVRADLAGGTLDLWPLGLMVEGSTTVNVALSLRAEVSMTRTGGDCVKLGSADFGVAYDWRPGQERGRLPLMERFLEEYSLPGGWIIETKSGSPPGAGLGGSSALSVALARALGAATGSKEASSEIVARCRDIEAGQLGIPTGVQDFWPAVLGGALVISYKAGGEKVGRLEMSLEDLAARMVVAYTGESRISAATNWQIYKRFIDGERQARFALSNVAQAAKDIAKALEAGDWAGAGEAMRLEMENRALLAGGVLTQTARRMLERAMDAGGWGGKVCGAGGGGCMVFLAPPEKKSAVEKALAEEGGRLLPAVPQGIGCRLEVE